MSALAQMTCGGGSANLQPMLLLETVLVIAALALLWRIGVLVITIMRALALAVVALGLAVVPPMIAGPVVYAAVRQDPQLDAEANGLLAALAALPLGLVLAWAWLRSRGEDRLERSNLHRGAAAFSAPPVARVQADPEPAGEVPVRDAWRKALALAPGHAGELQDARTACAALLVAAERNPLHWEVVDAAAPIRRVVPELVTATERLCASVDAGERSRTIAAMVATLQQLAVEAEEAQERERSRLRDTLTTLRTHVAALASRRRWRL